MKFGPLHRIGGMERPHRVSSFPMQPGKAAAGRGGRGRSGSPDESGKVVRVEVGGPGPGAVRQVVGSRVKIDNVDCLIMNESDIVGVLVEAEAKEGCVSTLP